MSVETWRDIPGWEGIYQASDLGRVRSVPRMRGYKAGGRGMMKGSVIAPKKAGARKRGEPPRYYETRMRFDGKVTYARTHVLVWTAFNGPVPPGMQVHHIDHNGFNNRLENLACVTASENIRAARDAGVLIGKRQTLTREAAAAIKALRKHAPHAFPCAVVGEVFGVTARHVSDVACGEHWSDLSEDGCEG